MTKGREVGKDMQVQTSKGNILKKQKYGLRYF